LKVNVDYQEEKEGQYWQAVTHQGAKIKCRKTNDHCREDRKYKAEEIIWIFKQQYKEPINSTPYQNEECQQ
jgi:hypothetical protein